MDITQIKKLAQDLVDLELKLREIENEKQLIKLELWDEAKGGIKCNGGTVYWVEPGPDMRFQLQVLKDELKNFGLTEAQIDSLLNRSKVPQQREANIRIRLDK